MVRCCLSMAMVLGNVVACGCGTAPEPVREHATGHQPGEEHSHPNEGPHKGRLIELGHHAFYAELVEDRRAGQLNVYLLAEDAKRRVPIDTQQITFLLGHDENTQSWHLVAQPDPEDPQGRSSCFVSSQKKLIEQLRQDHPYGQLVVTINGKQYRGEINHAHPPGNHRHH